MIVRRAAEKDIEGMKRVFFECEKDNLSYLKPKYRCLRDKKKPVEKNLRRSIIAEMKNKDGIFLVAVEGKEICGYAYGSIWKDNLLFHIPKTGEFQHFAVLKKYRSKGAASMLWNELLSWFKKKKCRIITLSVNLNNPAQEIYKHWGFEVFYLRMIKKM